MERLIDAVITRNNQVGCVVLDHRLLLFAVVGWCTVPLRVAAKSASVAKPNLQRLGTRISTGYWPIYSRQE